MKTKLLVLSLVLLGGCAHAVGQLVTHSPEILAVGGAAYAGKQVLDLANTTADTVERVEKK